MRSEIEMHAYQDKALDFAHANPKSALWIDMGLGKTVTMGTLLRDLIRDKGMKKALIVAPLRVATQTWPNEFASWEHLCDIDYTVIQHSNAAVRRQLALSRAPVHIINREMIHWLVDLFAELKAWPYDTLIIDEASSVKDHSTKRFKALRRALPHLKRIHALTATPATESFLGLFAQYFILDGGERFGRSVTAFREGYFKHDEYKRTYTLLPGAEEAMVQKISDITIVMRSEDYLDVSKPHNLTRPIQLTDEEISAYRKFERDLILKLPSDVEIEALNGAALNMKLMQAASGCVYDDAKNPHDFHAHKLDDLEQVAEEADGKPVLVGYWFKSSLDRLRKRFPKAVQMDKEGKCLPDWNSGKIKMLFAHPQSAGHGLNMQYGPCRDIYWFDLPWSHELYSQFVRRVVRQGQKNVVRVHHAVAQGTVDENVMAAHDDKGDAQSRLFERLLELRKQINGR
jgi:hypothetical protein